MLFFGRLGVAVASSLVLFIPVLASSPSCTNGVVLQNSTIVVGSRSLLLESITCAKEPQWIFKSDAVSAFAQEWQQCGGIGFTGSTICVSGTFCQVWNPWYSQCIPNPVKSTSAAPTRISSTSSVASSTPTPPPPSDVCDQLCTDTCGSLGDLPPITEDCAAIFNSITILNGSIAPTFSVAPSSIEQLTFGTCRVFFENLSATDTITYCWTSLAQQASAAGTLCFPPTQPVQSLGLCTASSGAWAVGIAHS